MFSGLTPGLSSGRGGSFALEPVPGPTTLTLSNTDTPEPVNSEANVTYTIQATNTGDGDAVSVVCTITLDAALAFVSNSGTGWTFTRVGQVITARTDLIPSGAAPAITVVATSPSTSSDTSVTTTATIVAANASSQNADATTSVRGIIAGVPRDATAKIYFPVSGAHWTAFRAATSVMAGGNPSSGWDLQETGTTNFADSIGSITLSQPDVAMVHDVAVAGFTRKGMRGTEATANQRAINFTTAVNPNTTSIILLGHLRFPASLPGGTRGLVGVADNCEVYWLANGHLRLVLGANTEGTVVYQDTDELFALVSDRTHTLSRLYTTKEIIVGTHVAPTSGNTVWDGGQTALACEVIHTWQVEFSGAPAEYADAAAYNAAIRAEFQAQGKTVLW